MNLQRKIMDLESKLNYGNSKTLLDQHQIVPKPLGMPATTDEEETSCPTQTNFFDQQVNGGSGESGGFFKKKDEKANSKEDYEKIHKEEESQGLTSNIVLLGEDATLTEMGGIFGSYAAQHDNLELETRHYEEKMRELRAKNQIKLNIDMAMNKPNQLEESEFLASEARQRTSARGSNQLTDRSETLALMKKEMEQAKKIIDQFQHGSKKDLQKNTREPIKSRPSSRLSTKKNQVSKPKDRDQREYNTQRESQFSALS